MASSGFSRKSLKNVLLFFVISRGSFAGFGWYPLGREMHTRRNSVQQLVRVRTGSGVPRDELAVLPMCCTAGSSHVQELAPRADASWVPRVCSACTGHLCSTWVADVVWLVSAGQALCTCAVGVTVRWAALGALLIILVHWMSQGHNLYMGKTSGGKDDVSQWIWIMQDMLSNSF